jgi:hypothetical protein
MRVTPSSRTFATLALPLFLASCDCTEAGCASGLEVRLGQPVTEPLTIEAYSLGPDNPRYVYTCSDASRCNMSGAFFEDYLPSSVSIRVTVGARTRTQSAQPAYRSFSPNGRDCGPTCRTAVVDIAAP